MTTIKSVLLSAGICALVLSSGCSNIKKLETENQQLKAQVSELEQLKNDYSDQLEENKRLSAEQQQQLQDEMSRMRSDLNSQLQEQIQKNEAMVQELDSLTVITLGEDVMFGSGLADLTRGGAKAIRQITATLTKYPGYHIRVEGHTDARPISAELKAKYSSNWDLSTARAISVIHYMIYGLKIAPERLSAVGYAQYRPAASNDTDKGRAQNRRIRIVLFKEAPPTAKP